MKSEKIKQHKTTTTKIDSNQNNDCPERLTWGPWVFRLVAVLSAVFIWWLVIYDHGVVATH